MSPNEHKLDAAHGGPLSSLARFAGFSIRGTRWSARSAATTAAFVKEAWATTACSSWGRASRSYGTRPPSVMSKGRIQTLQR